MTPGFLLALSAGLLPVLLFLTGLLVMDSYKLVSRRAVLWAIGAGVVAALVAFLVNVALLGPGHVSPDVLRRFVAPLIEEALKASYVYWLIRRDRVGFIVDAAIQGFAVGAGFAVVENVYYLGALQDPNIALWLIRGLGTAVMHGGTTALVGIVAKDLADRHQAHPLPWLVLGLAVAVSVHSLFNHLAPHPLIGMALVLVLMPLLLMAAYERSEKSTRDWLGIGLDADVETLELILSGEVSQSHIGRYLESVRSRFPGPVVADMLCLIQIHLELGLRAKGILIARQAGIELAPDRDIEANLAEMKFLERSIGSTGRLAILPFLRSHSRDIWQIHMMAKRSS